MVFLHWHFLGFWFFCQKNTLPIKPFPHSTRLLHRTAFLTLTKMPKRLDIFVMLKTLSEVTQLVRCIVWHIFGMGLWLFLQVIFLEKLQHLAVYQQALSDESKQQHSPRVSGLACMSSGVLLSQVFLLCACDPYQRLNLKSRSGCKRACKRSRNHLTDDITAPWRIVPPAQLNFFSVPLWFTHLFFKMSVNVTVHHLRNIFTGFWTQK